MINADEADIRGLRAADREAVRRLSCRTAFLNKPHELFFSDEEVLADALTLYFTDFEPESCFVAVKKGNVIGYITGAKNVRRMQRIFNSRIIPRLVIKLIRKGLLFKRKNRIFLFHMLISFIKGEFFVSDFSDKYPAILHVNIDEDYRGQNIGSMLIAKYTRFLNENNIRGVHCGTMSENAKKFFTKLGFSVLRKSKRSYLRYYLTASLSYYILGRKI